MFSTIFKRLMAGSILVAFVFSGCKKSASGNESINGDAFIQFSTNNSFGGKTEFKSNSTVGGFASRTNTGGKTQIIITAVQMDGQQIATAMLTIYVQQNYNGAISGRFENSNAESTQAVLAIGVTNAGTNQEEYTSATGNYNITKLTGAEIEGTFDAYCTNETNSANISLSSGKFSGKF